MFMSEDLENFSDFDYVVNSKLSSAVFTVMLMGWKAAEECECLQVPGT